MPNVSRLLPVASAGLLALIGAGCGHRAIGAPEPATTLIEGVSVVAMTSDSIWPNRTVVITGGAITGIFAADSLPNAVPLATLIDGRGMYLAPGLMDLHVHPYGAGSFPSYLAFGVTTIFDLNGAPDVLEWRSALQSGRLLGPRLFTTGPTLDGYPPLNPSFTALESDSAARVAVRAQHAAGYDAIKVYGSMSAGTFHAVVAAARELGMPVFGHINRDAGAQDVLRSGQLLIAHAFEFIPTAFGDRLDARLIDPLADSVALSGVTVTPNLNVNLEDRAGGRDSLRALHSGEIRYASPAAYSEKLPASNRTNPGYPPEYAAILDSVKMIQQALVRALDARGVPLVLGTDTEIYGFPGRSAINELDELVAAGFTPYRALLTGTRAAGDFLQRAGVARARSGVIALGARADLVLLRQNPLVDVDAYARPAGVMVAGRWLPAARLASILDSVARVVAPGQRLTRYADSVLRTAAPEPAVRALEAWNVASSGPPLAEIVMVQHARRLASVDPALAFRLRALTSRWYPASASALIELGSGYLDIGDTARAFDAFRVANKRASGDGVSGGWIERLTARQLPLAFEPEGRYALVRSNPRGPALTDTLLVAPSKGARSATIATDGGAAQPAHSLIVGAERMWFTCDGDHAGEFRLRVRGDSVSGVWVGDFGVRGTVRGTRIR